MHVLRLECRPDQKDRLVADLWERGTLGIVEEDRPGLPCLLKAFFDEPLEAVWPGCESKWEQAEDCNWVEVSQSLWEPVLVGSRFFLAPSWNTDAAPEGRIRLEMVPGQAYGTGLGETTQLVLECLERALRPGVAVLDLGTGSGILAVAAARLGAGRVYACDIDLACAAIARSRFLNDRVPVGLFAGSARSLRTGSIDLVAANINAETIVNLGSEIRRVLKPGGLAVFSGFPEDRLDRVRAAFGGACELSRKGPWCAMIWKAE